MKLTIKMFIYLFIIYLFICYNVCLLISCFRFVNGEAKERNIKSISWAVFLELFHVMKLSVHQLQKDACDKCEQFRLGLITVDEYEKHRLDVAEARHEKRQDKLNVFAWLLSLLVDLEKILLCPLLRNALQYFLCKLQFRNYTIFNQHTKEVVCKTYDESEGGMDSSNFASLLLSYLEQQVQQHPQIKEIIIWSDGCCAQNRNVVLSNALLHFCITHDVTVIQKYFVTGHSHNEVDSVHSRIESCLKSTRVYTPKMYVEAIANARQPDIRSGTSGYEVDIVDHTMFKDYTGVQYYSSIRPGNTVGDPTVNELRALLYLPAGTIMYKLQFTSPWCDMMHRVLEPTVQIVNKYEERLPIKKSKYKDLQKLKDFVPTEHHSFYDNLPTTK